MTAVYDVAPCRLAEVDRRFRARTAYILQSFDLHSRRRENLKFRKLN
jgi:hypothetical protein